MFDIKFVRRNRNFVAVVVDAVVVVAAVVVVVIVAVVIYSFLFNKNTRLKKFPKFKNIQLRICEPTEVEEK